MRLPTTRSTLLGKVALLALLLGVAGCANQAGVSSAYQSLSAHRYSPPPGPRSDPWGPYVREAASRFRIPEKWIRAVMRQESGGNEDAISSAGAMGLMQVMPATYAQLAAQYGLGNDPYEPHDNMMAGAAYLRQMYDRYGSPGFLAAYNAGPGRVDAYLSGTNDLPDETVNYVAAIAPRLGNSTPDSSAVSNSFAGLSRGRSMLATASPALPLASGCDPNAAYDPTRPCRPAPPMLAAPMPAPRMIAPTMLAALAPPSRILVNAPPCDPDMAYDPARTCQDVPSRLAPRALTNNAPPCDPDAAYDPRRICQPVPPIPDPPKMLQLASAEMTRPAIRPTPLPPIPPAPSISPGATGHQSGIWGIEMGTYARATMASDVAAAARSALPDLLNDARIAVAPTTPFGGAPHYRARLTALSLMAARTACGKLTSRGLDCTLVLPASGS